MTSYVVPLKRCSLAAATLVFLTALLVLGGWFFHIPDLTTIVPGFASMKVNTAVSLGLAALSLALLNRETASWRTPVAHAVAVLVLAIGAMTLFEYLFQFSAGIDDLLFAVPPEANNRFPARMSPISAFSIMCAGTALLWIDVRTARKIGVSEGAAVAMLLVSVVALVGYAYGVSSLYAVRAYSSLAVHTAVAFLALGCGILTARPDRGLISLLARDTGGAVLAQRLLPAAVVVPLVFGWLRAKGEQAGLVDPTFGAAVLVTSLMTTFVVFIWWTALSVDATDLERRRAEEALRASEQSFSTMFRSLPIGIALSRFSDGAVVDCNDAFTALTGFARDEIVGRTSAALGLVRDEEGRQHTLEQVQRDGWVRGVDVRVFPKAGEPRDVVTNLNVIELHGSQYILSSAMDITERKRAEEALRESEERFRRMADSAPAMIWIADATQQRSWFNRPWLEFVGSLGIEQGGDTWAEHVHPEDRKRCVDLYTSLFEARRPIEMEYRLRSAAATRRRVPMDRGLWYPVLCGYRLLRVHRIVSRHNGPEGDRNTSTSRARGSGVGEQAEKTSSWPHSRTSSVRR
jgi:PAS domain S-box-containing protein